MQLLTLYFCPASRYFFSLKSKHYVLNGNKSGLLLCSLVSNEILIEATSFNSAFCHQHRYPVAPNLDMLEDRAQRRSFVNMATKA